ncbi:hypothetical protein [Nitratireductor sp. XY-223]|nr:hypothetical protein [Nitratireductor sp. XY-223]
MIEGKGLKRRLAEPLTAGDLHEAAAKLFDTMKRADAAASLHYPD